VGAYVRLWNQENRRKIGLVIMKNKEAVRTSLVGLKALGCFGE